VHRLTGEVHASAYPGRIIITGKEDGIVVLQKFPKKSFSLIME
jgi:hypothetical protein